MAKIIAQAEPNGRCWCGCGEEARNFFAPGHDRPAIGYLTDLYEGEYENDGTANILLTLGFDPEKKLLYKHWKRKHGR